MSEARGRWLVGFLAMIAMATGTCALAVFSLLAPFLVRDLSLDLSSLGVLAGIVGGGGAVTSVLGGAISDRFGGRRVVLWVFVIGVFVLLATAAAPTAGWLVIPAVLCGAINGAVNPATNRMIMDVVPHGDRGLLIGVKQSGVQFGLVAGGIVFVPLAVSLGWRLAVAVSAVVPVAAAAALLRLVPADGASLSARKRHRYQPSRGIRALATYGFLMGAGAGCISTFLPVYATEVHRMSSTEAGLAASLVGVTAIVSRIASGRATERSGRFKIVLGGFAFLATGSALILASASDEAWVWGAAGLAGATAIAWNAVGSVCLMVHSRADELGRTTGLMNFGFLSGLAVGPIVFGSLVESSGGYRSGWLLVAVLFASALSTVGALPGARVLPPSNSTAKGAVACVV